MRTLSWKHTLGLVTMDVELADRTLSVAVTPVQAVVLLYFQDQGEPFGPSHAPELCGAPLPCVTQGRAGLGRPSPPPPGPGGLMRQREAQPGPAAPACPLPAQPAGPWRS